MKLIVDVPNDVCLDCLLWFSRTDLARLDSSFCNKKNRENLLNKFNSPQFTFSPCEDSLYITRRCFVWSILREIKVSSLFWDNNYIFGDFFPNGVAVLQNLKCLILNRCFTEDNQTEDQTDGVLELLNSSCCLEILKIINPRKFSFGSIIFPKLKENIIANIRHLTWVETLEHSRRYVVLYTQNFPIPVDLFRNLISVEIEGGFKQTEQNDSLFKLMSANPRLENITLKVPLVTEKICKTLVIFKEQLKSVSLYTKMEKRSINACNFVFRLFEELILAALIYVEYHTYEEITAVNLSRRPKNDGKIRSSLHLIGSVDQPSFFACLQAAKDIQSLNITCPLHLSPVKVNTIIERYPLLEELILSPLNSVQLEAADVQSLVSRLICLSKLEIHCAGLISPRQLYDICMSNANLVALSVCGHDTFSEEDAQEIFQDHPTLNMINCSQCAPPFNIRYFVK